ncbi:MAG: efflux RND transporter periplasmic adaptor subunit [Phascolarctobacterium sp.]|uniref:HlyD family secretion protein n=1 Tax=Phascolarctobacterium sp. TaxID=2049039 RepID=UPI0026DB9F68|nr:efflux RND transporter periplasmic adaptor subunit [Phascolarctobacterium sp.]MDO4922377.1 efflux RND transporter periplasmic adaptor subunit [Phascolarctobacterium sp.]
MKSKKGFCLLGALLTAMLLTGCAAQQRDTALWGQADATEVDVNTKVPGRLVELYVREGQAVHRGERLAQIDAREQDALTAAAKAKLEAAKAAAVQAKANLEQAQRDVNRYEQLFAQGAVSCESFENYRSRQQVLDAVYEQSLSTVQANEEALRQASLNLGETVIIAPFDGVVTTKYADCGAMISTGMPIVAVQDPLDNWVNFKVKETELGRYKLGDLVELIGRNDGLRLQGRIVDISQKPNFATYRATSERGDDTDIITFNVKVQVNDSRVRPGMRFRLETR